MAWQNCPINIYFCGVVGVSERTRIIPNPGGAKNWHGFPTAIPNHSFIPWEAWRISRYWIPFKAGNYIELAWTSHPVGWPSYSMLLLLLRTISSFRPGLRLGVSPSILRCEISPEKSSTGSFSALFEIIPIPCASVCFVHPPLFSFFSWLCLILGCTQVFTRCCLVQPSVWFGICVCVCACVRVWVCVCACSADLNINTISYYHICPADAMVVHKLYSAFPCVTVYVFEFKVPATLGATMAKLRESWSLNLSRHPLHFRTPTVDWP